ncbi:MAG: ATP phosphoribosyltransferase regulatory subunit [Candidatus Merdivicinus sp.]|jgi:ATP phosphoribosyltransferase regulatory subunit
MLKNKLIAPEGTRDILFEDCTARRKVEAKIKDLFVSRGFSEVITPGIEFYDVFSSDAHGIPQETMYKLVDSKGRLLALKPDLTMPIARLAATRLRDQVRPLRLYYSQNIYTITPALTGRSDEVPQIGVEIIGAAGKRTDLEVLVLALEALQSCNLDDFRLEIGHIGFFSTLIRKLNLNEEQTEEVRTLIQNKNYPALNDMLDRMEDKKTAASLKKLPALFGGEEVLDEAAETLDCPELIPYLDSLRSLYQSLSELGLGDRVSLDLGIVNRTDYYTGIVFKGYIEGLGTTALQGGRYDTLLSDYGKNEPAVGFSINVDAVAKVLIPALPKNPVPDVLVFAEEGYEVKALLEIRKLASHGFCAEFSTFESFDESRRYAMKRGIPTVYVVNEDLVEVRL